MSETALPSSGFVAPIAAPLGVQTDVRPATGWFARLLAFYLRHREATRPARMAKTSVGTIPDRAASAITRACVQSAVTGGTVGLASTGVTLVTASTEGVGGFVAIPIGALAISAEMGLRTWIHIDLICSLADIFEVHFDAKDPEDIWRLCALAFGAHDEHTEDGDPGKAIVHELSHAKGEQIGETIGHKVLGESVARSIIPVLGIGISAVTNYKLTRRLGDTTRRYFRYQRAFSDVLDHAIDVCRDHLELIIEGMWFMFIADGKLAPEESACLANFVKRLGPEARARVMSRMVEDEYDWLERLDATMPREMHQHFFHVLEVAAAVDKSVGVPERRLLRSAARRLGLTFDPHSTDRLMRELEAHGTITEAKSGSNGAKTATGS